MANLCINTYQKMKYFPNPLDITKFKNTNDFLLHLVCYKERACQLMKFSMSQEVKKGPFAAFIIESSLKVFWTYIQKPVWFYLLTTKDNLMGKVLGKTFSDAKCPGPLLQRWLLKSGEKHEM